MRKIFLMSVGLWAAVLAHAQTYETLKGVAPDSKVASVVFGEAAQVSLRELGKEWERKLRLTCDSEYQVRLKPEGVSVFKPIVFPEGANFPTEGVWLYRFDLERCGGSKQYTAVALAALQGPPTFREYMPGRTIASPGLIRDTLPNVVLKVSLEQNKKEQKTCRDFVVIDTELSRAPKVLASEAGPVVQGSYEETWTVRYCNEQYAVPICFTPKADGGTSFLMETCSSLKQ